MVVCKSEAKGSVSEAGGNGGYREYIYIKVRLVVAIPTITKPIKKKNNSSAWPKIALLRFCLW